MSKTKIEGLLLEPDYIFEIYRRVLTAGQFGQPIPQIAFQETSAQCSDTQTSIIYSS